MNLAKRLTEASTYGGVAILGIGAEQLYSAGNEIGPILGGIALIAIGGYMMIKDTRESP